jgi:hypothetical protein
MGVLRELVRELNVPSKAEFGAKLRSHFDLKAMPCSIRRANSLFNNPALGSDWPDRSPSNSQVVGGDRLRRLRATARKQVGYAAQVLASVCFCHVSTRPRKAVFLASLESEQRQLLT